MTATGTTAADLAIPRPRDGEPEPDPVAAAIRDIVGSVVIHVFAHPDDEQRVTAAAARIGAQVVVHPSRMFGPGRVRIQPSGRFIPRFVEWPPAVTAVPSRVRRGNENGESE